MTQTRTPVVAILESRRSRELAKLVERHGGVPLSVPAVRARAELTPEVTARLVDELLQGRHDIVVFMTGVSVALLFESADALGMRSDLAAGLRRTLVVCRGPKSGAALRGFGVQVAVSAETPFTSAELLDAMGELDVVGRNVLLFHYGERSDTLAETLRARGAELRELWLYRWLMPEDTAPLEDLIARILGGEVDALAVTCQVQFRHLLAMVTDPSARRCLVAALNDRSVVGAVGPTCRAILEAHDVDVQVMPDRPKMGPLVAALMRHLDRARHVFAARRSARSLPSAN